MKTNGMMIRRTALATMFAAVFALAGCSNLLSKLGESDLSLSGGVMLPTASGGSRYAAAVDIDDDGTVDGLDLDGDRTTLELIILETGTDAAAGLYALDADNDGVADIYLRVNTKTLSTLNTEADGSGTPAVLVENATGDVAGVDTSGDGTTDIVVVAVNNVADTAITVSAIPGVTVPAYGDTPVTTITATAQYTGTVTWSPSPATFAASTDYTATITLTAKTGYTLTGVAADFFTVTGSTSDTNTADSGVVTAAFPATTSTLPATITTAAIPGVTAPVAGATPVTTITETAQYTGTVAWSDTPVTFAASTAYTATITLTAKSGYTLTGVVGNFFTVAGTTSTTNPINSGIVTAVFPATAVPDYFLWTLVDTVEYTVTGFAVGYENTTVISIPSTYNGKPVTAIAEAAFSDSSLVTVVIPDSVTTIGDYAFSVSYDLTSLTIPASVTSIGYNIVYYCKSLTAITVADANANYCAVDGVLFNEAKTTLVAYPMGKTATSYEIPATVTAIGVAAFAEEDNLTTVTFPSGLTSIGESAFSYTMLENVTLPVTVTNIGNSAFEGCENLAVFTINATTPPTLGLDAFYDHMEAFRIEVPGAAVGTYEAAAGWSAYSAMISEQATAVTFSSAVQAGGVSGTTTTTSLTLTFSVDPTTLAASDITVTGATKGALTGTGTTRSLAISAITVANGATVSVAAASPAGFTISGTPQTAVVYKGVTAVTFNSVTQVGGTNHTATTTSLTLNFSVDPTTLTADNITLTGATKGALTGTGTTRSLAISAITVANGGTVEVAVASPSGFTVSGSPKTATVYKYEIPITFSGITQVSGVSGSVSTTSLTLTFSADPTAALTAGQITLEYDWATKGALTGTGLTRNLAISDITVVDGATVKVIISSPSGYYYSPTSQTVMVYKYTPFTPVKSGEVQVTSGAIQTEGYTGYFASNYYYAFGKIWEYEGFGSNVYELFVVNATTKTAPVKQAAIVLPGTTEIGGGLNGEDELPRQIAGYNGKLYIPITRITENLLIYDISSPGSLSDATTPTTRLTIGTNYQPTTAVMDPTGAYLWVAARYSPLIYKITVADNTSNAHTPAASYAFSASNVLQYHNGYLYGSGGTNSRLHWYNTTTDAGGYLSAHNSLVGIYDIAFHSYGGKDYLIAACGRENGIRIYEMDSAESVTLKSTHTYGGDDLNIIGDTLFYTVNDAIYSLDLSADATYSTNNQQLEMLVGVDNTGGVSNGLTSMVNDGTYAYALNRIAEPTYANVIQLKN